jgi:hypothetical protein
LFGEHCWILFAFVVPHMSHLVKTIITKQLVILFGGGSLKMIAQIRGAENPNEFSLLPASIKSTEPLAHI